MKNVLITGTSKGLGKELLNVFIEKGWKVFALARETNKFSDLTKSHDSCIPIECDITDKKCSEIITNTLNANIDSLDLLINNAGNAVKCFGIEKVTSEILDDHFKVHVSGSFNVTKSCLPFLQKSKSPIIINVSSRKGSINKISSGEYRVLFPYQIAKAAQNMFTACLNQELKDFGIKAYSIHPGNLKTDVAPPDADLEPEIAAQKLYEWINSCSKLLTNKFYNIQDNSILEW